MTSFAELQKKLASHVRDPDNNPSLVGVEDRRLDIYRGLIFRNIEGFVSGCFPIVRSLYSDEDWEEMVRDFMRVHHSTTPYFLEISEEFLSYLQEERAPHPEDPPFLLELAHYEWVELALDKSQEEIPKVDSDATDRSFLESKPRLSPLAWCLSYQYPVHQIGPHFQPQQPPETPTFLVVYRNRQQEVKFMEANAVTVRLINLLADDEFTTGTEAVAALAQEMQLPSADSLLPMAIELMDKLHRQDILI